MDSRYLSEIVFQGKSFRVKTMVGKSYGYARVEEWLEVSQGSRVEMKDALGTRLRNHAIATYDLRKSS